MMPTEPDEQPLRRPPQARRRRLPSVDRLTLGRLVTGLSLAWLVSLTGRFVPWHLVPAGVVTIIGIALLAATVLPGGRRSLVGVGVVALLAAILVGLGADRFAGPAGDLTLAPSPTDWPLDRTASVGTVVVDLDRHPLPPTARGTVRVGLGVVRLVLPSAGDHPGDTVAVQARIGTGSVVVDGSPTADGVDVNWTSRSGDDPDVVVRVEIGVGDLDISHGRP